MKRITTTLMIFIIVVSFSPCTVFAIDGDTDSTKTVDTVDKSSVSVQETNTIASGNYRGVDWKITTNGDLVIGKSGTTQIFTGLPENAPHDDYPWHTYRDDIKTISFSGSVFASGSLCEMFSDFYALTTVDLTNFDTRNVTDMSAMFVNGRSIISIKNLSKLNTENVTNMSLMYAGLVSITNFDLSGWDTSKVDDMGHMFFACKSITSLDLSSFDTRSVIDFWGMFENCTSLKEIELTSFDISNANIMPDMFKGCSSLTKLNLTSFDTSHIGNMQGMFDGCNSLKELKLGKWDYKRIDAYNNYFPVFPKKMFDREDGNLEYAAGERIPECDYHVFGDDDACEYITEQEAQGLFAIGNRVIPGDYGFYYKDSYFNNSSTMYNHSLATMSLCMALSTYNAPPYDIYDDGIKSIMRKCGFTGKNYNYYEEYDFNKKPTSTSIGCAIGSKKLKNGSRLIAVAVRSSGYEAEWSSNFELGLSGDHKGFNDSANLIYKDIEDYIKSHKIEGRIKIWLTGFSRGAAVATHTAAKLNKGTFNNVQLSKSDIYAYGFATPAGAISSSNPNSSQYNNIYNIIHYHDIVPLVAPEKWGFKRYGTTYMFPFSPSQIVSAKYETKMKQYLKRMGEEYELDSFFGVTQDSLLAIGSVGLFNRELVNNIAKNMGVTSLGIGARTLYKNELQNTVTNVAGAVMAKELDKETIYSILKNPDVYRLLIKTGANPFLIATATKNVNLLAKVHVEPKYYLAWMQVMDKNYGSELVPTFSKGTNRCIKVNCPVDVSVFDSNNSIVASIKDEKILDLPIDNKLEAFIDASGQKTVVLPIDGEYKVEVTARENCDVNYRVEEATGVSSELTRIVNFETVKTNKGSTLVASVDDYSVEEMENELVNGSSLTYSLSNKGEEIQIESEFRGASEIQNHSYVVSADYDEREGTVYGVGEYTEGEFAQLTAESNPGYEFEGFYIGGNKLFDDDLDKSKNTVRIKISGDVEVNARFNKSPSSDFSNEDKAGLCQHTFGEWVISRVATEIGAGEQTRKCSICGVSETKEIPMLAPSLSPVKIAKLKASKKSATIRWKKLSKKKLLKTKKIQIQYSTDKTFRTKVKNKYVSAKKTSLKINGLKSKKKYYIHLRAYTESGGTVHISKWSKVKRVQIK